MPVDILCIGHAAFDLCVSVDSFPTENSKCETESLLESGGGPAANAAYLLSSWGCRCAFAGVIGDDHYGRRIAQEFQAAGTDISLLEIRPGHATPLSIILINKQSGSRTVINRKVKAAALQPNEAALAGMAPKVLLFDGHELPASLAALRVFPDAVSILDAGSWREGAARLAGQVDFLAASERFALQSTGLAHVDNAAARRGCIRMMREQYSTAVIITLGEQGLAADDGSGFIRLPAYPARAVDTTAAGDIFHGALAYAMARGMAFAESLRFASMTASLSVRVAGGRKSIPALDNVKEALAHVG